MFPGLLSNTEAIWEGVGLLSFTITSNTAYTFIHLQGPSLPVQKLLTSARSHLLAKTSVSAPTKAFEVPAGLLPRPFHPPDLPSGCACGHEACMCACGIYVSAETMKMTSAKVVGFGENRVEWAA